MYACTVSQSVSHQSVSRHPRFLPNRSPHVPPSQRALLGLHGICVSVPWSPGRMGVGGWDTVAFSAGEPRAAAALRFFIVSFFLSSFVLSFVE